MNPELKRLREIVREMEQIMIKNDLAGHVVIIDRNYMEFRTRLTPSWSCLSLEEGVDLAKGTKVLRFKADIATGPDTERTRAAQSLGLLIGMGSNLEVHAGQLRKAVSQFAGHFKSISHREDDLTDDDEPTTQPPTP